MYQRYAIYFVPDGIWGDVGSEWLGWDIRRGHAVAPENAAQAALTERPRKYGFHATLKAPFKLSSDGTLDALMTAAAAVADRLQEVPLASLQISRIGRFFALTAPEQSQLLGDLAGTVVEDLDPFRAPLTEADLQRRRAARLTETQDALLIRWGYPYVMDEFRLHLTLTGPTAEDPNFLAQLHHHFAAALQQGLALNSLSVVGERADGNFEQIARFNISA